MKKKQLLLGLLLALFVVGSVGVPVASANTITPSPTKTTDRPGWGNGDHNHHHIGPPGHSVRPGDGDNDRDDHGKKISSTQFKQFFAEFQALFHRFFS